MNPANVMYAKSSIKGNQIFHNCDIRGPWKEAFLSSPQTGDLAKAFGVMYPQIDTYPVDLNNLPLSIAIIPLLSNVMPIAWCYGADVHVDEVDRDFYEAQDRLKSAFKSYYPQLDLGGSLVASKIIDNRIVEPKSPPLTLFSGGVDATFSLWGNYALKPSIVTIRGADVYFTPEDDVGWSIIKDRHEEIARRAGVKFYAIESSFKVWLAHWKLNTFSKQAKGWNWWFNQQQGPALTGLCAPLAWQLQSKRVIISSSFSYKDRIHTICGSNPSFDETMRYFGATVQHFDFSVNRQEKVAFLCEQAEMRQIDIPLRVCWKERTGYNCCKCEKCLRTIFAIYAEGGDPRKFGFDATQIELVENVENPEFNLGVFWIDVLDRLKSSKARGLPQVEAVLRKGQATKAISAYLNVELIT